MAIRLDNPHIVQTLLRNGADPNIPDEVPLELHGKSWFPINWATVIANDYHWAKVVKMLTQAGANINQSPVISSNQQQHQPQSIEDSISSVLKITKKSKDSFGYGIRQYRDFAPIFQVLNFAGPKPSRQQCKRPTTAPEYNDDFTRILYPRVQRLKHLLDLGAIPDLRQPGIYQTPMFYVLIKLLAFEPEFYYPTYMASSEEKHEQFVIASKATVAIMRLLKGAGADPKEQCPYQNQGTTEAFSPLHLACMIHSKRDGGRLVIDWLMRNGADIDATTTTGRTPLALLCHMPPDNLDCIKYFVQMGADVNHQDVKGATPLHLAWTRQGIWDPQKDVVKLLLNLGANPSIRNKAGQTPLFYYMRNPPDKISILAKVIEKGASPKDQDENGRTPLHELCAVSYITSEHRIKIIKLLLRNGADISAKDNTDNAALDYVKEPNRDPDSVRFLEEATARPQKWNRANGNKASRRGKKRQQGRGAPKANTESTH
ncbi:ankyrin repeat-containing domain protein [Camillea tinctor]|nr:ankyrin repeat-containing domain protein [Camillea tinctor]